LKDASRCKNRHEDEDRRENIGQRNDDAADPEPAECARGDVGDRPRFDAGEHGERRNDQQKQNEVDACADPKPEGSPLVFIRDAFLSGAQPAVRPCRRFLQRSAQEP
jgi:hypothetical protein